jgi:hypothetical protein
MKKILLGICGLALCGAGMMYVSSCALQKGPLSPNTTLLGANSGHQGAPQYITFEAGSPNPSTSPMAVSKTVNIYMTTSLNPTTVNSGNVKVKTPADDALSETDYTYVVVTYDAGTKCIRLWPDPAHNSGFWDDNKRYRWELTTGITSASGAPLDGNTNGIAEGDAFDSVTRAFYTGAPGGTAYTNSGTITITGLTLASPIGPYNLMIGNAGDVPIQWAAGVPSYVTLTVTFNRPVDQDTVWVDDSHIHSNLVFQDSAGTAVTPVAGSVTRTASSITAAFSLQPSSRYMMLAHGGLNGIRSRYQIDTLLKGYQEHGFFFDGNGTGHGAEASDDTLPVYITTQKADATTFLAPTLSSCTYGSRRWTVTFTTPSGNNKMDPGSLSGNIQLISGDSASFDVTDQDHVFGAITPDSITFDIATNTAYVYVPMHFITHLNDGAGDFAYLKVMLLHNLRSQDGIYFDGTQPPDGVGGLVTDDEITGNGGATAAKIYSY